MRDDPMCLPYSPFESFHGTRNMETKSVIVKATPPKVLVQG